MTNLEFINIEINKLENQIEYIKYNMKKYVDYRSEGQLNIDEIQLKINHLKQIKIDLKAWYIIKPDFVLSWSYPNDASGYYLKYFGEYEYETINSAQKQK